MTTISIRFACPIKAHIEPGDTGPWECVRVYKRRPTQRCGHRHTSAKATHRCCKTLARGWSGGDLGYVTIIKHGTIDQHTDTP